MSESLTRLSFYFVVVYDFVKQCKDVLLNMGASTEMRMEIVFFVQKQSIMVKNIKHILSSMRGVFLPYQGDNSLIPGGRVSIDELSYYGIYDDKKRIKGDMARLARDFRESTEEAKKKVQQMQ